MKKARTSKQKSKPVAGDAPSKKSAKARKPGLTVDAATLIDGRIKELGDWRGETLARLRGIITRAQADVVEEWKWDVPVWSCAGILCTGETYKSVVKLTFAKGASVPDPGKLFNSSLEGKTRRAIDFREGEEIDAKALTALLRAAAAVNAETRAGKPGSGSRAGSVKKTEKRR